MQVNGVNNYGYPPPVQGAYVPPPVTYTPYNPYGQSYVYNVNNPVQPQAPQQQTQYVTKQNVAMGILGAVIGFLLAGWMGAAIGGGALLLLGVLGNIFNKPKQVQQPIPYQQPYYPPPQQMPPNYNPYQYMPR